MIFNKKEYARVRSAIQLLDNRFRVDYNSIRINTHNNLRHELAKCKVAYLLIKDGKKIVTEAVFKKGRADIFVPADFRVYEILETEELTAALSKKGYYPSEVDIKFLTTFEILGDDFEL
jgi:hypothetical protein